MHGDSVFGHVTDVGPPIVKTLSSKSVVVSLLGLERLFLLV